MKRRPGAEPQSAAPDLEGLADFAVSTDRGEPVKFVGRVKPIATLRRSLEVGLEPWRRGKPTAWKGVSWLFQGAPGAGKTALLSHLESLKIEDRTTGKQVRANICLLDRKADLYDGPRLERKIAEAFIPGSARKMEGREAIREGGEAGVDIGIAKAGASGRRTTDKPLRTWEDVVREVRESPKRHAPLLLLVDEAQALEDAARRRQQYCQSRLDSSELQSKRHLIAAAVAHLGPGSELTVDDLAEAIEGIHAQAVSRTGSSSCLRLPDGYSGKRFAEAIIRAGVLHEDGDGYLSVPIPSFRAFLTERYSGGQ